MVGLVLGSLGGLVDRAVGQELLAVGAAHVGVVLGALWNQKQRRSGK